MIRALTQRHTDVADPAKGDCFATCVAMVLDLPQEEVPNFCSAADDWWGGFQAWLESLHLTAVEVSLTGGKTLARVTPGTPCILTGKSPRGDWLHSVVAVSAGERGFELYADPYPGGSFLDGPPRMVLFFASLRPDRTRKS